MRHSSVFLVVSSRDDVYNRGYIEKYRSIHRKIGLTLLSAQGELVMKFIQIKSESILKCWCGPFYLVFKDVVFLFCLTWVIGLNIPLNLKSVLFHFLDFLKRNADFGTDNHASGIERLSVVESHV